MMKWASDKRLVPLTSAQIRAARALIRWSAEDLAEASEIGVSTVRRAELDPSESKLTRINDRAIRRTLETAGVCPSIPSSAWGRGADCVAAARGRNDRGGEAPADLGRKNAGCCHLRRETRPEDSITIIDTLNVSGICVARDLEAIGHWQKNAP